MNININRNYDVSQIERTTNLTTTSEKATSFKEAINNVLNKSIKTQYTESNVDNFEERLAEIDIIVQKKIDEMIAENPELADVDRNTLLHKAEIELGMVQIVGYCEPVTQTNELTAEQIEMFNEKYDFDKMKTNTVWFDEFMNDLYNLGIISHSVTGINLDIINPLTTQSGVITKDGETSSVLIEDWLQNGLDDNKERYEQVTSSTEELDFFDSMFKNYYETNQTLSNILNTLTNAEVSTDNSINTRSISRNIDEFNNISMFERTEAEQAEYDKVMNEILGIDPSQKEEEVLISFDELTTEQKEELKNIIGDPNETNGYTQEKLDEYLQKLVEFKVITKLDAGYYGGHLTILYTDNNGYVINTRDSDIAISNNRDNWNGSIVEWFKQLERDVTSKLMLFGGNENYTDASDTVRKEIDRIKGMQELMEELFADAN